MTLSPVSIKLASTRDMECLARSLAEHARPGDCIALRGPLGAGKTAFARAFIQALSPDAAEVPSPTFTLLQIYPWADGEIWHLDLYRVGNEISALELGIEDAFSNAVMLIEWPEIIANLLPPERLNIAFEYGSATEERIATVSGGSRLLRYVSI